MADNGKITLRERFFSEKECMFADLGELKASVFIYESGVHAVKLENQKGHIVVLPFKGQQVWDAVFEGRRLTMKTPYTQPANTDFFLDSYGCFLMHCGALRMGCPGPEDDHPLHGELPMAGYQTVEIITGEDEKGVYIGITGEYRYCRAFGDIYTAKPLIRLYRGSSLMYSSMTINNNSNYPMELMYMNHINFRPVEQGEIFQSLDWKKQNMAVRTSIPSHVKVSREYMAFLNKLKEEPGLTSRINPGDEYNPEIAFFINSPHTDKEGFAHYIQLHPDGSADYVGYRPDSLDHATRWIIRTRNQEALGLALPATCDPEGYTAEKKKGNIKIIPGQGSVTFTVTAGYLDKNDAEGMRKHIGSMSG
jgi:hypothetical protein